MIKHFIDIDQFSKKQIDKFVSSAQSIKKNPLKYKNLFKNKTLGLLFLKKSTRTRLSFFVGFQKLGGNVIELDSKAIGFGKRESNKDIIKIISQYIDCLMIRNNDHKKILDYAALNYIPIINGLSDFSHPCQVLGDFLTLKEKIGNINDIKVCWIGDYNNVLRSLIQIQKLYSFKLNIVLPKEIIRINNKSITKIANKNLKITYIIDEGIKDINCIMTDAWLSMGEKDIKKKKYFKKYQINKKLLSNAGKNTLFMHCLPASRGEEVTSEVLDGTQSIVWEQAKNRIFSQQAILKYIIQKK